jgi:hypothetical protein
MEQVRAVAFIILYLVGFQILVLKTPPADALQVSAGVGMVVLGLTLFLEGLFLGLMPLGERVGVQIPQRAGIVAITVFGLLLGLGSTLAEPAIAALRVAGQTVTPWQAPLLYRMLEQDPELLVLCIGCGVGVAVAFGMVRLYYGLSIKPFVYVLVPVLLAVTTLFTLDPNLMSILGLAWDAGAVTTGAVTVPLVLALGIGVSRSMGKQDVATGGFGTIALASAFPVLGVMTLALLIHPSTPKPCSEEEFFSPRNRSTAIGIVGSEKALIALAFQRGGESGRRQLYAREDSYLAAVASLSDSRVRSELLGELSEHDWFRHRASEDERHLVPADWSSEGVSGLGASGRLSAVVTVQAGLAVRAVVPLVALLLLVLLLILRDRPRRTDEIILGIVFALGGMTLLTSGIQLGLAPLGDQVGRPLPRVFRSVASEEGRIVLESFERDRVLTVFDAKGEAEPFFYLKNKQGTPEPVPFLEGQYNSVTGRYEHILERPPLFGPDLTLMGIVLVFLFAFGLGYGSTMAEPALSALGRTVEELTVGTIKRSGVVAAVSVGVGVGLMLGVARILYDIPIVWLLVPPYLALLPLTRISEEDFAGIAWDCGGVTTGSITVPLVLALGLGIGGELNVVDGFGILAMASVCPIISVLLFGLVVRARQRREFEAPEEEEDAS